MKQLQNNFTTTEQSKRLLELGVPADSADFYWTHEHKRGVLPRVENILTTFTEEQKNHYTYNVDDYIIPCWSAGRLIEIFELCTSSKFERTKTKCSVLEDILWQIEIYVTETSKGFSIDFSKLEERL